MNPRQCLRCGRSWFSPEDVKALAAPKVKQSGRSPKGKGGERELAKLLVDADEEPGCLARWREVRGE